MCAMVAGNSAESGAMLSCMVEWSFCAFSRQSSQGRMAPFWETPNLRAGQKPLGQWTTSISLREKGPRAQSPATSSRDLRRTMAASASARLVERKPRLVMSFSSLSAQARLSKEEAGAEAAPQRKARIRKCWRNRPRLTPLPYMILAHQSNYS